MRSVWRVNEARGEVALDAPNAGAPFRFQRVFNYACPTARIYDDLVADLVASAIGGVDSTVLAYGQTAAGKTHTILGTRNEPGLLIRALDTIFDAQRRAEAQGDEHLTLRASYLEIYNEEIRDLLLEAPRAPNAFAAAQAQAAQPSIREDALRGVVVEGLHEVTLTSVKQARSLVGTGNARRASAATRANEDSSRSHALFRVTIDSGCPG